MPWSRGAAALAGKAGYTIGCLVAVLALVVSGFGYYVKTSVASIGGSNAVSGSASTGAMNILLMGLESRTYWSGQPPASRGARRAGSPRVEPGRGSHPGGVVIAGEGNA